MQVIRSAIEADTVTDSNIRNLILERIQGIADDGPFDSVVHGYFVVVQTGDTVGDITAQIGFDLLSRPVELLEDCGTCWDLLYIIDDSGYGIELVIPKTVGVPELLAMCQRYAVKS